MNTDDKKVIEIPSFLSHLKTYGDYPVPFVQIWIDGTPDFRVIDPERVEAEQGCGDSVNYARLVKHAEFQGTPSANPGILSFLQTAGNGDDKLRVEFFY